ncbi:hypothetical protein J3R83DRAFT_4212 [Lanmaoa asiatica]|nr:hypothetical protein J3R83DRAFT_4212 [Lanmaoa asiatica]
MLSNFRKRFLDPLVYRASEQEEQPFLSQTESRADASDIEYPGEMNDAVGQQHCIAMAETVYVSGCTRAFCGRHSETDDDADPGDTSTRSLSQSNAQRSLPSTRNMMQVLYPPSYLGTPSPLPNPPSYSDSPPYPFRGVDAGISPLVSSSTSIDRLDLLSQDPSLTGVPSQGTPSSRVPVDPNPPVIAPRGDDLEETEPLPAYSRLDQRRPRYPAASDILGPYPPLSALRQAARRRVYTPR